MMFSQRNSAAELEKRHSNRLPTPESRNAYIEKVASAMEAGAQALLETAKALRTKPDEMLKNVFEPVIVGMHPSAVAAIELMQFDSVPSQIEVRSRAIVDASRTNEVGFRALVINGDVVIPARDNRYG